MATDTYNLADMLGFSTSESSRLEVEPARGIFKTLPFSLDQYRVASMELMKHQSINRAQHEGVLCEVVSPDISFWMVADRAGTLPVMVGQGGDQDPRGELAKWQSSPSSPSDSSGELAHDRFTFSRRRKTALAAAFGNVDGVQSCKRWIFQGDVSPFPTLPGVDCSQHSPNLLHLIAAVVSFHEAFPKYNLTSTNCYAFAKAISSLLSQTFNSKHVPNHSPLPNDTSPLPNDTFPLPNDTQHKPNKSRLNSGTLAYVAPKALSEKEMSNFHVKYTTMAQEFVGGISIQINDFFH